MVAVGIANCAGDVKWGTFRNIFVSWVVTLPSTGEIFSIVVFEIENCIHAGLSCAALVAIFNWLLNTYGSEQTMNLYNSTMAKNVTASMFL